MGWFSKSSNKAAPTHDSVVAPATFIPALIDIDVARSALTAVCTANGNSDRVWDATELFLEASGMPERGNASATMNAYKTEGSSFTTRLWRWLVAAAEHGNDIGQFDIPAMAWFWGCEWIETVEPNLAGGDFIQLGFDRAPEGTHRALVEHCAATIRQMPEDHVLFTNALNHSIEVGSIAPIVELQAQADGMLTVQQATQELISRM